MDRQHLIDNILEQMAKLKRIGHGTPRPGDPKCPTRAQIGLLFALSEGPQNFKDIAHRFCISPSAATQLVDALVQDRLVDRAEDKTDRRKILLSLTEDGKKQLLEAKKIHAAAFAKLFGPLEDSELSTLRNLMDKIINNID